MSDDFRDLLAALLKAEARFIVVGAHALAVHGVPRVTGDLDVWIEPTADNGRRVWHALSAFGAPLDGLNIVEADFSRPDVVIQFGLPPYRVDILTSISGVQFAEAWSGRVESAFSDVLVPFLGREQFIRNKRASGRPKDLLDVESIGG